MHDCVFMEFLPLHTVSWTLVPGASHDVDASISERSRVNQKAWGH